jgi:hypothetical protein
VWSTAARIILLTSVIENPAPAYAVSQPGTAINEVFDNHMIDDAQIAPLTPPICRRLKSHHKVEKRCVSRVLAPPPIHIAVSARPERSG